MSNRAECEHRGTMTLTPIPEDPAWRVLDWCFCLNKEIKEECKEDCPYKDRPVDYE